MHSDPGYGRQFGDAWDNRLNENVFKWERGTRAGRLLNPHQARSTPGSHSLTQLQANRLQPLTDFLQCGLAEVTDLQQLLFCPRHQVADSVDSLRLQAIGRPDSQIRFRRYIGSLLVKFMASLI